MLYLASKSPRRRELLGRLGVAFGLIDLDIPEQRRAGEPAVDYVVRVAGEKARAGLAEVVADPDALVLGSDTEVILDDEVFGKPADADDARAMLQRLAGRTHQVVSAVSLLSHSGGSHALAVSHVTFAELDDAVIDAYVAGGDAFGKAGAYAIQGVAETFVTRLDGSHSAVMGLPMRETAVLLAEAGLGPLAVPA
jgi:septum formation protein